MQDKFSDHLITILSNNDDDIVNVMKSAIVDENSIARVKLTWFSELNFCVFGYVPIEKFTTKWNSNNRALIINAA